MDYILFSWSVWTDQLYYDEITKDVNKALPLSTVSGAWKTGKPREIPRDIFEKWVDSNLDSLKLLAKTSDGLKDFYKGNIVQSKKKSLDTLAFIAPQTKTDFQIGYGITCIEYQQLSKLSAEMCATIGDYLKRRVHGSLNDIVTFFEGLDYLAQTKDTQKGEGADCPEGVGCTSTKENEIRRVKYLTRNDKPTQEDETILKKMKRQLYELDKGGNTKASWLKPKRSFSNKANIEPGRIFFNANEKYILGVDKQGSYWARSKAKNDPFWAWGETLRKEMRQ